MKTKERSPEEKVPTKLEVELPRHVVDDLKAMEKHTKIPLNQLMNTALLMFIATHNDYLGLRP